MKSVVVNFRCTPELKSKIDKATQETGESISEMFERLFLKEIEASEKSQKQTDTELLEEAKILIDKVIRRG